MSVRLDGRVAIVTGAGGGLGRAHALALAARGARVVVNDLYADGEASTLAVVAEIDACGGEAVAAVGSVTDAKAMEAMVHAAMEKWGRIDILVNNAGVLRDKSFAKMSLDDFRHVLDVHVMGAVVCTKLVWPIMQAQSHGRVVFTTSSSGLFGNFGQANYGAAKMALVGLMQTLSIEGARYGIRVNCIAPTAATRMTAGLIPEPIMALLRPEAVSPAIVALASDDAPSRAIICAGAGVFERAYVTFTRGIHVGMGDTAAGQILAQMDRIGSREGDSAPESAAAQIMNEAALAHEALKREGMTDNA